MLTSITPIVQVHLSVVLTGLISWLILVHAGLPSYSNPSLDSHWNLSGHALYEYIPKGVIALVSSHILLTYPSPKPPPVYDPLLTTSPL